MQQKIKRRVKERQKIEKKLGNKAIVTFVEAKGEYIKYVVGGRTVLQIFQKIFRSPGDYRPKYFMAQ